MGARPSLPCPKKGRPRQPPKTPTHPTRLANYAHQVVGYTRLRGGVGRCSRSSHTDVYAPGAVLRPPPPQSRSLRFLSLCIVSLILSPYQHKVSFVYGSRMRFEDAGGGGVEGRVMLDQQDGIGEP